MPVRVMIMMVAACVLCSCSVAVGQASKEKAALDAIHQGPSSISLPADVNRLELKEMMAHVFQFAGDAIWKWQGYSVDAKGEHSLFPKTDEEWEQAESGALTLAELTTILLLPGRRVDDPRWGKSVAEVRAVALRAADAAERHDEDAFFEAGGDLDTACESCHLSFAPGSAKPGILQINGKGTAG